MVIKPRASLRARGGAARGPMRAWYHGGGRGVSLSVCVTGGLLPCVGSGRSYTEGGQRHRASCSRKEPPMLRRTWARLAVVALAPGLAAADKAPAGNWKLSPPLQPRGGDTPLWLIQVESKEGAWSGKVL